jgi:dTDP-L-rhamnose 4-epimerase
MAKPRTLVTGGLGFIGSHLIRTLTAAGHSVRVIDSLSPQIHGQFPSVEPTIVNDSSIQFMRGDILNPKLLDEAFQDIDCLIHLAAETGTSQSMYEIARYNSINSQGTALIMDRVVNLKHSIKKVILASSRSIYGEGAYNCEQCGVVVPDTRSSESLARREWEPTCPVCGNGIHAIATSEHSQPRPASIYAATKLAQEDLIRIACQSSGVPYAILRFQNVYGAGQSLKNPYTGILSIFSTRIRRGMVLPIFEDGMESRDFVEVKDVVRAITLCMPPDHAAGQVFNVGSGVPTTVLNVASMLNQIFKGTSETEVTGQYRVGDIRHCYANISALRVATGFEPRVSLEQGLAAFATWVGGQPLPDDGLDQANRALLEKGLMK